MAIDGDNWMGHVHQAADFGSLLTGTGMEGL